MSGSVRKLDQIVVKTGRSVVDFKSSVNESSDKAIKKGAKLMLKTIHAILSSLLSAGTLE